MATAQMRKLDDGWPGWRKDPNADREYLLRVVDAWTNGTYIREYWLMVMDLWERTGKWVEPTQLTEAN